MSKLYATPLAIQLEADVVGMAYDEAIKLADAAKLRLRITKMDKKARIVTRDYRLDRINVEVEDGIITHAYLG